MNSVNTNYRIERFFEGYKSIANIVEERFATKKAALESLTIEDEMYYNSFGGSIDTKEVKQ